MRLKTSSVDWSGNYEETCIRLAKILGRSKIRRKLFNTIYGRGTKARSRKQLAADAGLRPADGQQAQNELDVLASCGLIHKERNDGQVNNRSKWVYSKDQEVRAHRADVVKFADKPALAKKVATKRNPVIRGSSIIVKRIVITRQALKRHKHVNVLYLMANPIKKHSLRVDAEIKAVNAEVRRSKLRDNITLHQSPAADYDDILHGLNDHNPRIIHFSGHGNSSGVAMDGGGGKRIATKFVSFDLLARALAATDTPPEVVVLNACDSAGARKALLGTVKAVIAMEDSVSDMAAVAFATKFYGAIASGLSLQAAYDQGCAAVAVVSLAEVSTPALSTVKGVDARKIVLA